MVGGTCAAETDGYVSVIDVMDKNKKLSSAIPVFIEAKRQIITRADDDVLAQIAGEAISVLQYNQSKRYHHDPEVNDLLFGLHIQPY